MVARPEKMGNSAPVEIGGGLMLTGMIGASKPELGQVRSLPFLGACVGVGDSRCRDTGGAWGDSIAGEAKAMGGSTGPPASLSTAAGLSLLLATSAEGGGGEGEGDVVEGELPMMVVSK